MISGGYKISSIEWGDFKLDGGAMFGVVPKNLWSQKIPSDEQNMIPMKARGLFLEGHNRKILIDLGTGSKDNDNFKKRFAIKNVKSPSEALKTFGLSPEEITDVIITHLHFDHCGGSTIDFKGKTYPAFKNAKYHIQKNQWNSAVSGKSRDSASFLTQNFLPLFENGNIVFADGENDLDLKNISLKITSGHTFFQQHPLIEDNINPVFYCGDIFPTSAHISPKWVMAYDNHAEKSVEEKRQLLEQAVEENWIMFFEHDPLIAACRIEKKGRSFEISETLSF
ncbi:MAG: MBL fold metallo-hydrolase [Desulfobacteraceae bacterium]|nr:MBL fold metallo-hydrolase [Desulfobacteraceae bacterium]